MFEYKKLSIGLYYFMNNNSLAGLNWRQNLLFKIHIFFLELFFHFVVVTTMTSTSIIINALSNTDKYNIGS